jgi:hypothetical protein
VQRTAVFARLLLWNAHALQVTVPEIVTAPLSAGEIHCTAVPPAVYVHWICVPPAAVFVTAVATAAPGLSSADRYPVTPVAAASCRYSVVCAAATAGSEAATATAIHRQRRARAAARPAVVVRVERMSYMSPSP